MGNLYIFQNDKTLLTYENFESNPPSIVNLAKFDCLDLFGPGCSTRDEKWLNLPLSFYIIESLSKGKKPRNLHLKMPIARYRQHPNQHTNPFHARFTVKTVSFMLAKLVDSAGSDRYATLL